jgi:autotransporter-associated beta strand protein
MSSAAYSITGTGSFSTSTANVILDTATVALADTGSLSLGGNDTIGGLSGTGGTVSLSDKTLTTSSGSDTSYSGVISGTGGQLTKSGNGKLTLSGGTANTFTGLTTVSGGTLELSKTAGVNAIAGAVAVNSGAVLLLSASNQINNDAAVSLSGGTIRRGSGVTETFGALTLGAASTLDFGAGTTNSLNFGTYTGGGFKLNVTNFLQGNILTFKNDLSGSINNTSLFGFDNGFTSSWNSGASTFTITAIPEPSTYLAAAGLFALFLWPIRRRLLKDAKFLLGLRPTGRA